MTTENENQEVPTPPQEQPLRPPRPQGQGPRGPRPGGYRPGGPSGGEDSEGGPDDRPGGGGGGRPGPGGPNRRPRRGGGKDRFAPRRKVCQFCADQIRVVDYKDFQRLRRYLSDRGKIEPRRKTGTCARHQRSLTTAIKRARYMALLPYVVTQAR